jgi:glycerophosphoryl diester phosphodiesterase
MGLRERVGAALFTLALLTGCTQAGGAPAKEAPAPAPVMAPAPRNVEVVAHRGGYPENTLSAFRQALATPEVGAIELDVQVSKDGELFVIHDKAVDRTTTGKGNVKDLTAAEIRDLKTPKAGAEQVPTLDDVLALVAAAPEKRVVVEIKAPNPADTPARVVAALEKHGLTKRSVVISFDRGQAEAARKAAPAQETGFLSKEWNSSVLSYPGEYVLITSAAVTRKAVEEAHAAGKKFYVWTVDDKMPMEAFMLMGVDGIISNTYEVLVEVKKAAAE